MVWVGVATAGLLAAAVGWMMVRLGPRLGVVDLPDGDLKPHTGQPVPLGGVGLMFGLHVGLAGAGELDPGLLAATGLAFLLGLVDDIRGLSPLVRLIGATVSGVVLVALSDLVSGWPASLAAVGLVVLAVNAINLFDGLDALASSVGAVAAIGLAVYAVVLDIAEPLLPVVLAAALAGVLVFNWPPARLYLGDNGAYVLGVTLAWAVLRTSTEWDTGLLGVALIGVPLLDLGVTLVRRLVAGQPLFAGDRDHSYDRLHRRWGSVVRVVASMSLVQVLWSAAIILVYVWGGVTVALVVTAGMGISVIGVAAAQATSRARG